MTREEEEVKTHTFIHVYIYSSSTCPYATVLGLPLNGSRVSLAVRVSHATARQLKQTLAHWHTRTLL